MRKTRVKLLKERALGYQKLLLAKGFERSLKSCLRSVKRAYQRGV